MAKEYMLSIRLDEESRQLLEGAARADEISVSTWARRALRRAAVEALWPQAEPHTRQLVEQAVANDEELR